MNLSTARYGEELATEYLRHKNITIIERNFRTKVGEIDIIGRRNDTILFVEVKTRVGKPKGMPYEAVDKRKISHLKKAAAYFLLLKKEYKVFKLSVEVVSIVLSPSRDVVQFDHFEKVEL